ncbi:MAG: M48 family metalloprotease [Gammaproteobacteria bacterium]
MQTSLVKTLVLLASAVFICIPAVLATNAQNLPEIGDSAGSVLSPEFERRLGQAVMRQVHQDKSLIQDPEIESYIQSIGYQLVANSDDNRLPFTFFALKNTVINAFAAPGGVVGMNSGVILNTDNESELAGVLAHEIAHVTQRHMARTYEAASKFSLPMMAAMIGAIAIGIVNPGAGQAALAIVSGAGAQYQINFTRENEEEADRIGMQLLARSGFDPRGMPGFFQKLQQFTRYYGKAPEFLLTHPLTTTRIADSMARAESYPVVEHKSSAGYRLVRAKIRADTFERPREAVRFFKERMDTTGYPDLSTARYGYVIALTNAGEYIKAREQLHLLLAEDRENVTYLMAAARLETAQRNFAAAASLYSAAHKLYPDYRPLVLGFARALLDAGQPQEARKLLVDYGRRHEPDISYYDLLSQAEADTGSPAEAGITKAEYYYLSGDTKLAIDRLKFAQHQSSLDYYQEERIKARLAQLEYELELEKELEQQ